MGDATRHYEAREEELGEDTMRQIERRVMPFMEGADYLGPEFRGDKYRLKFMRDGRVIWVDVDAATGRILGMSGR